MENLTCDDDDARRTTHDARSQDLDFRLVFVAGCDGIAGDGSLRGQVSLRRWWSRHACLGTDATYTATVSGMVDKRSRSTSWSHTHALPEESLVLHEHYHWSKGQRLGTRRALLVVLFCAMFFPYTSRMITDALSSSVLRLLQRRLVVAQPRPRRAYPFQERPASKLCTLPISTTLESSLTVRATRTVGF